jgi:hypothetical protein
VFTVETEFNTGGDLAEFRHFRKLARPMQSILHPRQPPRASLEREIEMSAFANVSKGFAAAASAFALSLVLITGTVSVPSNAQAQTTFVSAVA